MTAATISLARTRRLDSDHRRFALIVFGCEAVLLTVTALHHKPWFDEAQAWLLARDTGPVDLVIHHLRYEGSPGLWHLLLMVPAKLGLPYQSMAVISVVATLGGSALLLWRSPFPRPVAALLCFSFFLFFQYGVVARSYCLLASLLFLLAMEWRDRLRHPLRLALLLSLLANVSLHGTLIAATLAVIHCNDVRRGWRAMGIAERRLQLGSMAVVGVVLATVGAELVPPADLIGGGYWHFTAPWEIFGSRLVTQELVVVIPTLVLVAGSLWWFWARRCLLIFALPAGAIGALFMFRYFSPWHVGTLFLLWVFTLWISLDGDREQRRTTARYRRALLVGVTATAAGQVAWTALSIQYDWTHSYSASADVAGYVQDRGLADKRIDLIGKWGIGILPYFSRDIFHNYNHGTGPSYFPWTYQGPITGRTSDVLLDRPDVIIVSVKSRDGTSPLPCLPGYRQERSFPGGIYWPGGVMETESFALYRYDARGGGQLLWGNCGRL